MACFDPNLAWYSRDGGAEGGTLMFGRPPSGVSPVFLPCGKCKGCLLERSRQWAVRCMHEASLYDDNCFVTLTYNDESLPAGGSLVPDHMTLFLKRLRKRISPIKVRYYYAGEYGTQFGRPHYHALLFGYSFPDAVFVGMRHGYATFRSSLLEQLWDKGFSEFGSVSYESAAYVARYVVGKDSRPIVGVNADGEYAELEPEFSRMSRRPGIGRGWLDKFGSEVYPADGVVVNGKLRKPPKYYDIQVDLSSPELMDRVRAARRMKARLQDPSKVKANVLGRMSLNRKGDL